MRIFVEDVLGIIGDSRRVVVQGLLALGAMLIVLLGVGPTAARAATATATVFDETGDNGVSFDGAPTDVTGASVHWDGDALTMAVTYAQPSFKSLHVLMADAVDPKNGETCDANSAESLDIQATATRASLTMPYVDGQLDATAAWSGSTVAYSFASPVLASELRDSDPFACVSGESDGDGFIGAFDGRVLHITSARATVALRSALARRYGRRIGSVARCRSGAA
jgi:hypothetical protein